MENELIELRTPAHVASLRTALEQRLDQLDEDLRNTPFPRKMKVLGDIDRVTELLREVTALTDPARS